MRSGLNHVAGGVCAAVILPLLVLALHLPFLAALVIAMLVYGGVAFLLTPRRAVERIDASKVGRAQAELVASLIGQAEAEIEKLRQAGERIRSAGSAKLVAHLGQVGSDILKALAADPEKLPSVRRFLTYYLPRSAELAEGVALLETQRKPDPDRTAKAEAMLTRLDTAFTHYADNLAETDLDELDVELKLLERSLAEDIGPGLQARSPEPVKVERR